MNDNASHRNGRLSGKFPRHIRFSLLWALLVWVAWLAALGTEDAFRVVMQNWKISLTMVFGSLVAGGTAEGGGAIAFPVLTKLLHVHPADAKVFALAIQSVGMSSASLAIIMMRVKVEWRAVRWAIVGGIPGIILGTVFLAPLIPPDIRRMTFTVMQASFGLTLVALNHTEVHRHEVITPYGFREKSLLAVSGALGGVLTGLVGTGIDIVVFSLIVLLFRISEKIATPTTVILQAVTVIVGFLIHGFGLGDFTGAVRGFWLAAIPVVVVGAPLGAMICAKLSRVVIVRILLGLIGAEVVSSLLIIPMRPAVIYSSVSALIIFLAVYYRMYRIQVYQKEISREVLND